MQPEKVSESDLIVLLGDGIPAEYFLITCLHTALLGAFAMLTIPFVSTWIVSTTGVGQAVGGMVGGAAIATKAVAAPATGGASAAM